MSNICFQFLTGYMKNLFSKDEQNHHLYLYNDVCKVEMPAGYHLVKRTLNQPLYLALR